MRHFGLMTGTALVAFILIFSCVARAADGTLAAQGDYVLQGRSERPWAHWKLWHLREGGYNVVETDATNSHIVQTFTFDSKFLPTGFSLTIDPYFKVRQRQNSPLIPRPTMVSCRYHPHDLECETEINGKNQSPRLPPQIHTCLYRAASMRSTRRGSWLAFYALLNRVLPGMRR